jgi:hypothetical protein
MKKLYFLNEEEKQRILKLHKSRQVGKFWLNEQHDEELDEQSLGSGTASTIGSAGAGAATGAGVGAGIGAGIGSVGGPAGMAVMAGLGAIAGTIIGGVTGGIYGLVSGISSGMNRASFNRAIETACTKDKANAGTPTMGEMEILETAKKLHEYINTPNTFGLGYATQESRTAMKEILTNVPTLPDFCHIANQYKLAYGTSLLEDLRREIYYDSYYSDVVKLPLLSAVAKSIDLTKEAEEGIVTDPKTGKKTKKMNVKGKQGSTYTSDDLTEKFVEVYPCFAGIATETKDFNIVYILNPSRHSTIIDTTVNGGTVTTIAEKTFFKNDGTYYKSSDRNKVSGTFECGMGGEEIWLTPTSGGVGKPETITDKYPCLTTFNAKIIGNEIEVAEMDDESRARHPDLSKYPKGKVFFFINGEFLTEFDEREDKDMTGTFSCGGKRGGKSRLKVTPASEADWSGKSKAPEPKYRLPGMDRPKNSMDGMGVVSISASYISEILKCAKIGGSTLTQDALNQLYDYIKNNK